MEANNQDIMVPPGSNIKTVSELAHKTIAVNVTHNIGQLLVSSVLSDNAVPANSRDICPHPVPGHGEGPPGPPGGRRLGAASRSSPRPRRHAGAIPLADSNQGTTENLPISGYMVTASWLKKYPNTAAAFRRAILKAQAIAATDPAAVQQGMEAFADVRRGGRGRRGQSAVPDPVERDPARAAGQALMLHFNMINQQYGVSQMISK